MLEEFGKRFIKNEFVSLNVGLGDSTGPWNPLGVVLPAQCQKHDPRIGL